MPATVFVDKAAAPGRGVSKLSRAFSKLNLRSPVETDATDIHALQAEQIKILKLSHPNAKTVISRVSVPPGLARSRVRDYIHSTSITPKGKAFLPQYSDIIPNRLYISDHFTGTDAATLSRLRITHVVSILNVRHPDFPMLPTIAYHELVVPSDACQARRLMATIDDTVEFIDHALRQDGNRVLVHCRTGVQWSPVMVIAWLMRNGHCDYEEARETVRRKREVANPGFDLEKGVKEWLALEMARPLFPPGRGGRKHSFVCSRSPELDFGHGLFRDEGVDEGEGEVLDIRRYS